MAFKLDKKLFTIIVIGMIVIIAITGGLIAFKTLGGFNLFKPVVPPVDISAGENPEEETGPWGDKTYSFAYKGSTHTLTLFITKDTYKWYQHGISGTLYPENITAYIVTSGDGGVVSDAAGQIKTIISHQQYTDDADIVGVTLAFIRSIPYQTDTETGHSEEYPRPPVITLAEQTGDSGDHAILAAAILEELGYGCALICYPQTYDRLSIIPDAVTLGLISSDDRTGPVYPVNSRTVAPFWTVDTAEKNIPAAAYNGIVPDIFPSDAFTTGKPYSPAGGISPPLATSDPASVLDIPGATNVPLAQKDWQQNVSAYYADSWHSAGVSWKLNDKWQLHQQFVAIKDVPAELYTPWGTTVHNASVPWRIVYQITQMDEDNVRDMTPYSDVRIAVYTLNETTSTAILMKTFGWQGLYGADKYRTVGPFSPGNYVIAVFVRNAGVDITLEYHGKPDIPEYTGGI